MSTLHRISSALLDREILDGDDIDKLIRGEELPPLEKQKDGQPAEKQSSADSSSKRPAGESGTGAGSSSAPAKTKKNA